MAANKDRRVCSGAETDKGCRLGQSTYAEHEQGAVRERSNGCFGLCDISWTVLEKRGPFILGGGMVAGGHLGSKLRSIMNSLSVSDVSQIVRLPCRCRWNCHLIKEGHPAFCPTQVQAPRNGVAAASQRGTAQCNCPRDPPQRQQQTGIQLQARICDRSDDERDAR